MVFALERSTGRFQYGDTRCWILRKNLGGAYARRLMDMVELHFQEEKSALVLDLRQVPVIDSEGARCLELARRRHAKLRVVGRSRDYATLPLSIRKVLNIIRPFDTLEEALSFPVHADLRTSWPQRRRHHRIPVQIPVEIFLGGRSAVAVMHDISLGGGRLGRISSHLLLEPEGATPSQMTVTGIDSDPLGLEIVSSLSSSEVVTRPVYVLPRNRGMGVQFAGNGETADLR